jgi:hypothetical protein
VKNCLDDGMSRSESAGWIGRCRIPSQQQGLTAATTEIFGSAIATAAWFWHPGFAAEAPE